MKTIDNDRELRRLMKEIRLEKPGTGFSASVMDAVLAEAARKTAYRTEPILGKKFWVFVGLFVVLAIVLILFGNGETSTNNEIASGIIEKFPAPDLGNIKGGFSRFWDMVSGLPITIGAIMTATSVLILADKFFSSRQTLHLG
jgi:hypothetical protein